jgi:MFS transporter, PPP family, 3-phenylpropionic acid transporter
LLPPILARAGLHTTAFYFVFFATTGVHLPFWPLWLGDWGLTATEVGLFTSVGVAVRVVAGLAIPALADRVDAWRMTAAICSIACALFFLAHLGVHDRIMLLVVTIGAGAAFAGLAPIGEALGIAAARIHGFPYAQARGLGSIGFLAANLIVGALMARLGTGIALWWIVACLLGVALLGLHHPGGGGVRDRAPPSFREIGRVISLPVFAIFMGAVAFSQASHATYYALGSFHWRALGIGEGRIGALWAFSVAVEVLLMVAGGAYLMNRVGAVGSLVLAGGGGLVRWGAMMADPTGLLLWPLQALHALSFAAGHLGAMAFIARAVPARYGAAAQGATGAMAVGLALAVGMVLSAALYPHLGGRTYAVGLVFSGLGLGLTLWLGRRWSGEELTLRTQAVASGDRAGGD